MNLEPDVNLRWIAESHATWDEGKARIVGGAPAGVFDRRYAETELGERVPGEWWRVESDGRTVGYGWLDIVWGDAEVLLATDPEVAGQGIGSFILEHLEAEAGAKGVNYVYNTVRPTHPAAVRVTAWLKKRGFEGSEDGSLLRATIKADA